MYGLRLLEVTDECLSKPVGLIDIAVARVLIGKSELPVRTNLIIDPSLSFILTSKFSDLINLLLGHMVNVSENHIKHHLFHLTVLTQHLSWAAIISEVGAHISDHFCDIKLHVVKFPGRRSCLKIG